MIIGISGKPRRGKDTLAVYWAQEYGYQMLSWAGALRQEVEQPHTIGVSYRVPRVCIDEEELDDPALAVAVRAWMPPVSPKTEWQSRIGYCMTEKDRTYLQWWGTLYRRRHHGEDYWLRRMEAAVAAVPTAGDDPLGRRLVIPDTRFPNEAEWIREQPDGYLVRVEADHPFEEEGGLPGFISETALDGWTDWDAVVHNDFTPHFFTKAEYLITRFHHSALAGLFPEVALPVEGCLEAVTL